MPLRSEIIDTRILHRIDLFNAAKKNRLFGVARISGMHDIFEMGLSVIHWVQQARTPALDHFFIAVTKSGSEYFYFAMLPIICTLINRKAGLRIAMVVLASVMINSIIKTWVGEPRPYDLDPSVALLPEAGFAFPSGHTQSAMVFWSMFAFYVRRAWALLLAAFVVGLMAVSRIYLGAHFPTDVLASIAIGGLIVLLQAQQAKSADAWWQPQWRPFVFAGLFVVAVLASYFVDAKDIISASALNVGLVAGIWLSGEQIPLSPSWKRRLLISVATGFVLLVIYAGLKHLFPEKGDAYYGLFSFVRYALCGLCLSAMPVLLQKRFKPAA
jgi:membrane-associated phospholipid phosphatase